VPSQFDILTRLAEPELKRAPEREPSEERAILIGIVCTVLFHVLLLVLAPRLALEKFVGSHSNLTAVMKAKQKTFEIELVPPPPAPEPFKFIETNPDAPSNTPDKTKFFSNRNQQSAQAEAAKEKDEENKPSVKGQDEIKNDSAIVSGTHTQPQDGAAVTPNNQKDDQKEQQAQQARAEQVPLSGDEKLEGKDDEGIAANKFHNPALSTNANELVEGAKDGKSNDGAQVATNQTGHQQPRARPRLSQARQNILTTRAPGTTNIGVMAVDALRNDYGDYLQELIEVVQAEWYSILDRSSIYPKAGTHVFVMFRLNARGEVTIQSVEDTAGKAGSYACTSAITNRQPYRKWTPQMEAVLGEETTIGFNFYYQ
jgi:hypothetical protein